MSDATAQPVQAINPVKTIENGTELAPKDGVAPVITPETKKDLQSSRFAALAKKETALVRDRAALKAEREQIAKERSEASKLVEAQKLALTDPLKALELLGLTYKQLTEVVLNDNQPTPELREKTLEERLQAALDKKLEDRDKAAQELTEKQKQEQSAKVVAEFKSKTEGFLKNEESKKKFPLINHPKNDMQYTVDTISAMIEQHFYDTAEKDESGKILKPGILMSVSDAASHFENHLSEISKAFYEAKNPPKSDGQDPKSSSSKEDPQEPRTISNLMSTSMVSGMSAKTEADRLKRAMAALG